MVEFFFKIFFGLIGFQFLNLGWLRDKELEITIGLLAIVVLLVIFVLGKVEDARYEEDYKADKQLAVYKRCAPHRK